MTNPRRVAVSVAVALLLACSLFSVATGSVAAQEVRDADLEVQQPHYVENDVTVRERNGSTVYEVQGSHLRLYPQAFDPDNVVDTGINPQSGQLSRADAGDGYTLDVSEAGTYQVYWVVERTVTENNETRTERARYEASVQVTGALDVTTIEQQQLEDLRNDADRWEQVNATVQSQIHHSWFVRLMPGRPTADEWIHSSLNKQQLVHNPAAAFGNGITLFIFGVFSLGGGLIVLVFLGWHAKAITWLRERLNQFESVEYEEGELNKRFEQRERDRATESLQNDKFSDLYLPHTADAMRELGDTPLEADCEISANGWLPSVGAAYKAQAMALDGYVGALPPDDDTATDGGDPSGLETEDVLRMARARDTRLDIQPADGVDEDAVTLSLKDAERDWFDVLPVSEDVMLDYTIADKDIDRSKIQVEGVQWTPEQIIARTQLEARHFDSPTEAATHFVDFLQDVREHPITDSDGEPRTCRVVMETLLRDSQLLDDVFNISKQYAIDMFESAIEADDPVEDGLDIAGDIEEGKYA